MLHTNFGGNRPTGSGEEDFLRFLPYMGMAAILVMTWTIYTNFRSPFLMRLHIKFGFDWPSGFREKIFENGGQMTDGRRLDGYTISSPCEPNGSGELKMGEIWGRNQNDKNGKFSLFLHKIICCRCVLESPHRGDSNTHPKHMILWRTYDN